MIAIREDRFSLLLHCMKCSGTNCPCGIGIRRYGDRGEDNTGTVKNIAKIAIPRNSSLPNLPCYCSTPGPSLGPKGRDLRRPVPARPPYETDLVVVGQAARFSRPLGHVPHLALGGRLADKADPFPGDGVLQTARECRRGNDPQLFAGRVRLSRRCVGPSRFAEQLPFLGSGAAEDRAQKLARAENRGDQARAERRRRGGPLVRGEEGCGVTFSHPHVPGQTCMHLSER